MNKQERIQDIESLNTFAPNEIETVGKFSKCFKSWEYFLILHFTNAELYYLSDEEEKTLTEQADEIQDTPRGKAFFYK